MPCCNHTHPFDSYRVAQQWHPSKIRCLIIGENPGSENSQYFYAPPRSYEDDLVKIRRGLLRNLFKEDLLLKPTLEGFRDAGFLFDHAIRCPLPPEAVAKERSAARRVKAKSVQNPEHLRAILDHAPIVWVMGHLACNAVANLTDAFPRQKRKISRHPYPGEDRLGSRFFVSAYLTRWNPEQWPSICSAFVQFAKNRQDSPGSIL